MTKMLKITLNGETFLADMLWDKAPETCQAVRIVLSGRVTYLFGKDLRCRGDVSCLGPHRQLRAHREPRLSRAGGRRKLVWRLVVNLHLL